MSSNKVPTDERGAKPCKRCKRRGEIVYPVVDIIDGMYYTTCPICSKAEDRYDCLGLSEKKSIAIWNSEMGCKG